MYIFTIYVNITLIRPTCVLNTPTEYSHYMSEYYLRSITVSSNKLPCPVVKCR